MGVKHVSIADLQQSFQGDFKNHVLAAASALKSEAYLNVLVWKRKTNYLNTDAITLRLRPLCWALCR